MDHLDSIKSTPLQIAYREARRIAGKQAVYLALREHGAVSGLLEDCPAKSRDALFVQLRKLANGGHVPKGAKQAVAFEDIRKQAYGDKRAAAPTTRLDPVSIYDRWNNPPPVDRD